MIKIIAVEADSIAEELNINSGDYLLEVNGKPINDRLDYRFHAADESLELLIRQGNEDTIYEIEKDAGEDLGIELEEMKMRACGNNCVFCFVYQNPKGMRKALYFKDEDYRYSFLYGHYVTMTTMKQKDLDRIVEQRLSPLYISVHATEEKTRKLLLGIKRDDHLLDKIDFLTQNGIELHTQIVLCPGINDGAIFDKTVADLKQFYPGVKSVAVVPVGLTRHREGLMHLRLHSKKELKDTIAYINNLREKLKQEMGVHFVYPADEFFIKAGLTLPEAPYYDEFYQIENGVGEFRDLIDHFEENRGNLPKALAESLNLTWVTGTLARGPLEKYIIEPLRKIKNMRIELVAVKNHFYGTSIQVSGLLTGKDIYQQLENEQLGDMVLLPPRVLNDDGLFLDDWSVDHLESRLKTPCHVYTESIANLITVVSELLHERKTGAA